jgi:hypothetical protein
MPLIRLLLFARPSIPDDGKRYNNVRKENGCTKEARAGYATLIVRKEDWSYQHGQRIPFAQNKC